jgi:hypothetical protein
MLVLEVARDLSRRRRREENVRRSGAGGRLLRQRDVGFERGEVLPLDRARAGRPMLERRGEVGEHRRELGKVGLAGAERRGARAIEAGEAVLDVGGVIGTALLAVIDDVEPAGDLLGNDVADRAPNGRLELGRLGSGIVLLVQHELHHRRRPRQAAGMGGEDALDAALHGILFFPRPAQVRGVRGTRLRARLVQAAFFRLPWPARV